MIRALPTLALVISSLVPVAAQEVVGRVTVNDREVVLLSDGTWQFAADGKQDCQSIAALISICVKADEWAAAPLPAESQGDLAFRHGSDLYAVVRAWETAKTYDEMTEQERAKALIFKVSPRETPEEYERSIQESLRDSNGLLPTLAGRFDTRIGDEQARMVVFSGKFGTRAISFVFTDAISVVVETTDYSSLFSDEHEMMHASLLAGIALGAEP